MATILSTRSLIFFRVTVTDPTIFPSGVVWVVCAWDEANIAPLTRGTLALSESLTPGQFPTLMGTSDTRLKI